MKVLFAVNDEKISESIIKRYQTMYKEIISWKNVYFFNAIIKELQKDKSYDRIVIGEDLEPYTNNNYEVIDNFIYDKLDAISDEASNSTEGDIPIILIATDRRDKGDSILIKLFGLGIYNVLLGKDRSMENVCRLINQPRTKKEAKIYYKIVDMIDHGEGGYQPVYHDIIPEDEMNNIIRHYKKIAGNEDEYISSFDDIASQYTQEQLRIIAAKLPLNVRAVLEERSPKYQQVMIGSVKDKVKNSSSTQSNMYTTKNIGTTSSNGTRIGLINQQLQKNRITKPVVIPSSMNLQNVEKVYKNKSENIKISAKVPNNVEVTNNQYNATTENIDDNHIQTTEQEELIGQMPVYDENTESVTNNNVENMNGVGTKRGRGRPPKNNKIPKDNITEDKPKRGRGRPPKNNKQEVIPTNIEQQIIPEENIIQQTISQEEPIDLFNLGDEPEEQNNINTNNTQNNEENIILPGFDDNDYSTMENTDVKPLISAPSNINTQVNNNYQEIPTNQNYSNVVSNDTKSVFENNLNSYKSPTDLREIQTPKVDLSNLLVGDKKIVAFVGTSKNGTSFIVNNLAELLSEKGIKTAILDLTENKNAYYIYNLNDDTLRNKAFNCIEGLRSGIADGIPVNKNFTVYTTLPGENPSFEDYGNILETLVKNYSLVLLDCDFKTYTDYFINAQEIYLVQSYDILTIQPLTAFLNDLQHKNALDESKLRIVLNKTLKLKKLTDKMIIGGISRYNDPATTYQNTLFNYETIRYTKIPFEEQTYAKYLERLVDCEVNLSGYSKLFLEALNSLGKMVYPLIASDIKYKQNKNYNDYSKNNKRQSTQFNSSMDATLNKMRKNI